MYLYPEDIFEKLEFNKILERLSEFCMGDPARHQVLAMRTFNHKTKIERMLDEIVEYQKSDSLSYDFPLVNYTSVLNELGLLKTIDYVLEIEDYIKLFIHIKTVNDIVLFFNEGKRKEELPLLYNIASQIEIDSSLIERFDQIFSEDGKIKPSASPELKKVFSAIRSKERELEEQFNSILKRYKKEGLLSDNLESVKNSRRVLSVNVENKRKIKGIIHDESKTGKTVFIEPEEIMNINNDLFELEARKRQEVYKILKALSALIRPHLDDFLLWQKILIRYDLIRSKAKFSHLYDGCRPHIEEGSQFEIKKTYHPLLLIMNNEQRKSTVPFSLTLNNDKRILVISGPNAGGKSVTLKALGLNQLMLQSGMLIPCDENSKFGLFSKMMIDIGDQQSLEGDLSTYSSRLLHMKHFVEKADKRTMILMDEFGSGSDPKMGGAIAEGVLDKLVKKRTFALITTHYSNIKNFAYKNKHIVNGAMLFNKDELKPTYKLKVGQPGSSFAFEIANKIGLSEEVLSYAKNKAGKDSEKVDRLLIDLQEEKKVLDEELLSTYDEKHRLKKLIETYERMKSELDIRRKKMKLEAREKTYLNVSDSERELQHLIKKIKEDQNIEKAKSAIQRAKNIKKETRNEMSDLSDDVFQKEIEEVKNLEVGQFVKLRTGGQPGQVIQLNDKKVRLQMGILQMEVPRSEVILANQPIEQKSKSIITDTKHNPHSLETKLDIRGYTKQDASEALQEFFDNSLLGSSSQLKILHGKGSGVLKKLVWKKAKEYKDFQKIWHPEEEFGGHGVTFVSF